MLFLWSVIECHQYRVWHYINLNLVAVSFKEGLYLGYAFSPPMSALVRQMAWYRQATNHYLITWTNVDDATWRHIASLGLKRLTNRGSVTPCDDIGLGQSCLTAPSHFLNQCWPISTISKMQWLSSEGHFTKKNTLATSHYLFKILINPRGQWFK